MKLIKFLSVIIVLLVIANVTITNRSVDEGVTVANLGKEISALQNQNTILAAQVASAGSLGNISARLVDAGFVETKNIAAIQSTPSVASR